MGHSAAGGPGARHEEGLPEDLLAFGHCQKLEEFPLSMKCTLSEPTVSKAWLQSSQITKNNKNPSYAVKAWQ
jgi:hypothetical protein